MACVVLGAGYFLSRATSLQQLDISSVGKTIQIEGHYDATTRRAVDGGTQVIIGNHIVTVANGIWQVNDDQHAIADTHIIFAESGSISVEILP